MSMIFLFLSIFFNKKKSEERVSQSVKNFLLSKPITKHDEGIDKEYILQEYNFFLFTNNKKTILYNGRF